LAHFFALPGIALSLARPDDSGLWLRFESPSKSESQHLGCDDYCHIAIELVGNSQFIAGSHQIA
jgi:hypothetical protein